MNFHTLKSNYEQLEDYSIIAMMTISAVVLLFVLMTAHMSDGIVRKIVTNVSGVIHPPSKKQ